MDTHKPVKATPRPPATWEPPQFCEYCGTQLHPGFYFCLACATPYKDIEAVLPEPRPVPLTEGELIARKAPNVAPLFWTYFAVVVATAVVSFLAFDEYRPDLGLLLRGATVFVTTAVFAALHWRSLAVQLKRFGFLHPAAWLALLGLAVLLPVNYLYHRWVVDQLGIEGPLLLERLRESGLGQGVLVFLFCVLPAVTEETAFRGLVQHWLRTAIRPGRALLLASALFTVLHFSVISAPYLFAVGMLLGWAKQRTGSLYPSMLGHFLHNLVVLEFFRF